MFSRDTHPRPLPPPRFRHLQHSPRNYSQPFGKRDEICHNHLKNKCIYGASCHRRHIDPSDPQFPSGGVASVNRPRSELFPGTLHQPPPCPPTFDDRLTECSTPYNDNDTSSDESYCQEPISIGLNQALAAEPASSRGAWSDSETSSTDDIQGACPPRICRDWCRGECRRTPCRFLHVKHSHGPLIQKDPIIPLETEKHPHPKSNEICWGWERDWCQRGYDCEFVHGDLQYDSPVLQTGALPDEDEPDEGSIKYPRPRNSATCVYWLRGYCHRGPITCPYFHGDVNYEDPPEWPLPDEGPADQLLHPRPPRNETCRNWRRGLCELGYDCKYVHEDLVYDDLIPGFHRIPPSAPVAAPPPPRPSHTPNEWTMFVHDHIKVRLSAGFEIQELTTGFETPWIFIEQLPVSITESKVMDLLSLFGTAEIKTVSRSGASTKVKAKYTDHVDARNASTSLDNTKHFGTTIRAHLSVKASGSPGILKDCTVRLQWDAPSLVGYGGYYTLECAEAALAKTSQPFKGYHIRARFFRGLPAVGMYTIQFRNLPVDTTKEDMKVFAKPIDMVWEPLPYTSVPESAGSIRRLISRNFEILGWDMTPPPYRDGFVRVFATFASPSIAAQATEHLHLRKPLSIGGNRLSALHLKELTFKLPTASYNRITSDVVNLRDQINARPPGESISGLTVTPSRQTDTVFVKLFSNDLKELGRLKGQFEGIQRGHVVMFEGKTAWDSYFNLPSGIVFFQTLQRRHQQLLINRDPFRRRVTLHGPPSVRIQAQSDIVAKLKELRQRMARVIPLPGHILGLFVASEYPKLKQELGTETISIDLWNHTLVVRGTTDQWVIAKRAVQHASEMQHPRRSKKAVECPICFDEVASPCTLRCGHTHCRSCLKEYLLAATDSHFFPLTCLGNAATCTELIPLAAAKDFLTTSEFNGVVTSAYSAYIAKRPTEFHPCPTPDCPQVYRPGPAGNVLQCPACLVRICSTCHCEDHEGVECPDTDEQELAFKEWKRNHDVKACPGCKVDIERSEGCNHVTCIRCQTHICWACSQTFPRGEGIYDHMRAAHGGIGLVPHF